MFSDNEGKFIQVPDPSKAIEYLGHTKNWEESCTYEIEKFGGDSVLINEERMKKADRQLKKWIDMTERLLGRHPTTSSGENKEQQTLKDLFDVNFYNIFQIISYFCLFRVFIFYTNNIVYE